MLGNLISNRGILAGLVFFLVVVGSSLLYSWHVHRTTKAELEQTTRAVQTLENKNEAPAEQDVGIPIDIETLGTSETALDTDEVQTTSEGTDALAVQDTDAVDIADVFLPDDFVSEKEIAEDVSVSPFGFGPYPEVPEGWPADTFPAPSANHELLARVEIKLLSQGTNTAGANMENGLVYPVIKGTAYVKWKSYLRPDGEITYISDIIAHPEDGARLNAIRAEKGRSLTEMDVPSDIKLVSFEAGAIDPYQFLDLP
ncbi:MAG: hypothetical protein OXH39_07905 [Candidatus Poribacteria bacterium]|nr:hypothetical protein [Candidatus Poribacteria bacterium]